MTQKNFLNLCFNNKHLLDYDIRTYVVTEFYARFPAHNTWIDFATRNKIEYWKFIQCDRTRQNEVSCTTGKWN